MPISIDCTTCGAKLKAPDRTAGAKIKCPKCQAMLLVPDLAQQGASGISAQRPPEPAPRRVETRNESDRADDEGDDSDFRERRSRRGRRSKKKSSGAAGGVCIGMGIGGIVLGLLAVAFSFIPFCGAFVALPAGGLGLVLAVIGAIVGMTVQPKSGLGLGLNGAASFINLVGIGIAILWWAGLVGLQSAANTAAVNNKPPIPPVVKVDFGQQKQKLDDEPPPGPGQGPRTAAARAESQQKLKQLAMAMHNYASATGSFPPAKWSNGKLSWRVAILPYLEQNSLYRQFKLNEDWDSPANKAVLEKSPMPEAFRSPIENPGDETKTYYQLFTGPGTAWPNDSSKPKLPASYPDGTSNTLLIAEARTPVFWTQPEDIRVEATGVPKLGGIFGGDFNAAMADGSVHLFGREISAQRLRAYITPNGGELVELPGK
jgi:hypothetical protein